MKEQKDDPSRVDSQGHLDRPSASTGSTASGALPDSTDGRLRALAKSWGLKAEHFVNEGRPDRSEADGKVLALRFCEKELLDVVQEINVLAVNSHADALAALKAFGRHDGDGHPLCYDWCHEYGHKVHTPKCHAARAAIAKAEVR